ncbi:MAG: hypothetical protein KC484_11020 [Colwelliaceae bacterium]|jgi:hypothetical protein|nr:hypothetical protein [Colwelliaceae bacterium]
MDKGEVVDFNESEGKKKFLKKIMLSMFVFLLLIAVQTFAFELYELNSIMKVVMALLPVVPLLWLLIAYRTHFLSMDEYMQKLTGESLLWSTGILAFGTFAYGMLMMKMDVPPFNIAYILPLVFGGHGVIVQILLKVDNNEK